MEITLSRSRFWLIAILILLIPAGIFLYRNITRSENETPAINADEYTRQPAIQALATIYAPAGDQPTWEQQACLNMTQNGCDLFKAYYAPAIWKSGVKGTDTKFVEIVENLEDGTQVWLAGTNLNGSAQPLFIQVQKREDGNWYLARLLFEEEAKKYEK